MWAYGLRNPWRFSFDRDSGDLYIGDVGQDLWEEVDLALKSAQRRPGANYGWNVMEATHCYLSASCTPVGVLPIVEYSHAAMACAIVGGYVYRGSAMPVIQGYYFYADNCNAEVDGIKWPNVTVLDFTSLISPGSQISSFGQDAKGELYIMRQGGGEVYRIVPSP